MLILSLHVVELEDMEMERNCWNAAHIPRVNKLIVWHFVMYILVEVNI